MQVRRVVTTRNHDSKSTFHSVGNAPGTYDYIHVPGMSTARIWSTPPVPSLSAQTADPTLDPKSVVPAPGGTQFLFLELPPDSIMQSAEFDGKAAHEESLKCIPGLAECFEPENPGMHTSDTIDYGIVLEGEIWLELDDGREEHLRQHDVIVQNGTRHAWRNKSDRRALMAFVLIGARRG